MIIPEKIRIIFNESDHKLVIPRCQSHFHVMKHKLSQKCYQKEHVHCSTGVKKVMSFKSRTFLVQIYLDKGLINPSEEGPV